MRSCQHLLNLGQCSFGDHDLLVEHQGHWICVTWFNDQNVRQIARSQFQVFVGDVGDDQYRFQTHAGQLLRQQLGFWCVDREIFHHNQALFTGQLRQDRADTSAVHLLVHFVGEVLVRRVREDATTAAPQWRRRHTSTSTAGTFLAPWLLGRVVDFFTVFLFTVAAACIGLVSNDDLVDQGFIVVTAEDGIGGSNVRGGLTLSVQELEFHRLSSLLCFNFDSRRNHYLAVFGARDRTFDQQQLTVGVDTGDFEVLHGRGDITHVTGHAFTREHAAWILRHTNRTWNVVRTRVTVGSTARSKVVTLDGTGIAFTNRHTLNIDFLT